MTPEIHASPNQTRFYSENKYTVQTLLFGMKENSIY